MTTDHTPRDTAERLINHSRKARPIDLPGIGNVAAAAAILDLADAIREAHTPPLVAPELDEDEGPAPEPCAADGCVLFDGHEGEHSATRPPIDIPHMTTVRGGPRYHHALHTDGTVTPFAAITVDEPKPEFCTSQTRSDPTPDGKQALVSCNRVANHPGLHIDGSWVWAGEPGHEYALTNLDSGGGAHDLPDVVRHMSPADANTVVANMTATPHAAVRDPERAERLDHTYLVWRLRVLAGKVRRAMSLEPLPVAMTIDELLDDLEANVDELATSRDEARAEWESAGADRRAIADALGVDCHIDAILAAVNPARS